MNIFKSFLLGTTLFAFSVALPANAQTDVATRAFEGAKKCYGYEFDDASLDLDKAIMVCAKAVEDLTAIRQLDGKDIGLAEIDSIADIAGTSAMKWAALAFSKSGGAATSDVCVPVGFANSLFEIMDEPKASKSKQDSGANMLAELCTKAGVPLE